MPPPDSGGIATAPTVLAPIVISISLNPIRRLSRAMTIRRRPERGVAAAATTCPPVEAEFGAEDRIDQRLRWALAMAARIARAMARAVHPLPPRQ